MWKRETGDNLLKFSEEGEPHDRLHDTPFGPQETVNEDDECPVLPLSGSTSRNLGPPHSGWRLLGRVGERERETVCDYECCCVHADHLPREQGL